MGATSVQSELSRVAGMIGDPSRAAILEALLAGPALPAGVLARRARIAPSTASAHLARLVESGLVTDHRSGRNRFYALAGAHVAEALEALSRISSPAVAQAGAPSGSPHNRELRFARTCYDHLAGRLGVAVTDAMIGRGLISRRSFDVTESGEAWLKGGLEIEAGELRRARRAFTRRCLDWTERRDHLAGAAGAAITSAMLERRWIARLDDTRAVRLTLRGRDGLYRVLGLEIDS